jgi:hypothetical protein
MGLASCLQRQNVKTAVLGEAMGERRARRSGADDDEIDRALVHGASSSGWFRCALRQRMIPKSGQRFSEKIMRQQEGKAR